MCIWGTGGEKSSKSSTETGTRKNLTSSSLCHSNSSNPLLELFSCPTPPNLNSNLANLQVWFIYIKILAIIPSFNLPNILLGGRNSRAQEKLKVRYQEAFLERFNLLSNLCLNKRLFGIPYLFCIYILICFHGASCWYHIRIHLIKKSNL